MSTHTCKQTYIRTYILKKLCVYVYILYIYTKYGAGFAAFRAEDV